MYSINDGLHFWEQPLQQKKISQEIFTKKIPIFFTLFFHVVQRKYFNGGCLTAIVDLKVNFIFEKSTEKIYAFFSKLEKVAD